ncbi:MAG TPA: carboxypeptidase-like regulatory domain-containing protein, partial [Alphaproteobacteria bacterium]|nr:carboxypeptidase-like regulatory domain-containing protein [Alphaproteobacteria bacterium]
MKKQFVAALFASTFLLAAGAAVPQAYAAEAVKNSGDDIGGTVTSAKGPEAGVWVIAETKDLPTRFIKIVVTDDKGQYLIPDLPKAKYKVWVRGYGLVDSDPVDVEAGKNADLKAVVAPSPKDAAEYYPAAYWYSLLQPPAATDFPGTGATGNGISPMMVTQQHWLENMKEQCMFCHQLGDKTTRTLLTGGSSVEGWGQRIQMARADGDPAIGNNGKSLSSQMQNNMAHFGKERGLKMYAEWTDKIAAGALPPVPPRPEGVERNVVLTIQDWGQGRFIHDQASSYRWDPKVNAGGPIYGMGTLHGTLEILDPKTHEATKVDIPGMDGAAHNADAGVHADEIDYKGRVWMPSIYRDGPAPAWCSDGSVPSSKLFPLTKDMNGGMYSKASALPVYDPATKKVTVIPMCTGGNHSGFTDDSNHILYMSGDTQAVSWINLKVWDETHDPAKATGWCPMVMDTNGDGKITQDKTQWNKPTFTLAGDIGETGGGNALEASAKAGSSGPKIDGTKDTVLSTYLYGASTAKDGSVWLAGYVPYVPSGIVHMIPGKNPPETCKTEFYQPPKVDGKYKAFGIRGVGVEENPNVAWAAFSSGQIGRFDRSKCKVTNGPTATGQQCPEGWTFWDLPSPKLDHTEATSDFVYSEWADFSNVMGLGKNTHFFPAINSDSVLMMKDTDRTKLYTFRVPYPMGFYTRGMDFRIND